MTTSLLIWMTASAMALSANLPLAVILLGYQRLPLYKRWYLVRLAPNQFLFILILGTPAIFLTASGLCEVLAYYLRNALTTNVLYSLVAAFPFRLLLLSVAFGIGLAIFDWHTTFRGLFALKQRSAGRACSLHRRITAYLDQWSGLERKKVHAALRTTATHEALEEALSLPKTPST